jgi:hypothetical protein
VEALVTSLLVLIGKQLIAIYMEKTNLDPLMAPRVVHRRPDLGVLLGTGFFVRSGVVRKCTQRPWLSSE